MTNEDCLCICPFLSSAPYFVACKKGMIMLMPSKVTCEVPCASWENNRCIRLGDHKCDCGDTNV